MPSYRALPKVRSRRTVPIVRSGPTRTDPTALIGPADLTARSARLARKDSASDNGRSYTRSDCSSSCSFFSLYGPTRVIMNSGEASGSDTTERDGVASCSAMIST